MNPEPTAADIEGVARRDKITFQRLAVDLLRVRVAGSAVVRGYDLGPGRKDFGFDAEIDGEFERLAGRIRVSAKGNLAWADLRRDARDDARRHPELPLLLLCAMPLDARQVQQLAKDARAAGVPAFDVAHGCTLAEWLRDAPHLEHLYLRGADCALVPVEEACVRFAPRAAGRAEAGPSLESEETAVQSVLARKHAGARAVLLLYAPDTRPERCLWKTACSLALAPSPEALTWVRTDGSAPLPADAWRSPAFARHPHTFIAPWGHRAVDLVNWWCELPEPAAGRHRIVLAVARGREHEVEYELGIQGRDVGAPARVDLDLPEDVRELETFSSWLLPNVHSRVRREAFCEMYGLRPALMEIGSQGTHLLATRGQRAFPEAADLRALALIAVFGSWPAPAPVGEWMLGWLGRNADAVDGLVERGRQAGWLDVRGDVHVPSSRANRWALVHAWKGRDPAGWRRLVHGLRSVPMNVLAVLLPGLAEVEQYQEVEAYLLNELAEDTWHHWGSQLATLATSGERVHERILELAERALRVGSCRVGLEAVSEVVLVTPLFARNLVRALRVCTLLRKVGLHSPYANRTPSGLVKEVGNPHSLAASAARRALEWAPDGIRRGDLGVEEAEAFVSLWLREGVGVEESSGTSFSFGTSRWNAKNPELPGCWRAAASVVLALLKSSDLAFQTAGWRLIGAAGEEVALGPRPKEMHPPDPLVAVVADLVRASLEYLPPESNWSLRHQAERALLRVTERSFIPAELACDVLSRFSHDPLFRAWEICVDRHTAFPDPEEYARVRTSRGIEEARRGRIDGSYDFEDERAGPLAVRLAELTDGASALLRLLDTVAASMRASSDGWRGFEVLRTWAAAAPSVYEDVILGPAWSRVPREVRREVLWAVAPVIGPRLLGEARAGAAAAAPQGAAVEMARFLAIPAEVAAEDALALVPAAELAAPPAGALAMLRSLAQHPDAEVRRGLSTWMYRLLLRKEHSYESVRDVVLQLCRCPGGLPAIDALLMLSRRKDRQRESLLVDDLARAFREHIDSESDEAAWRFVVTHEHGFRPLIWETFMRSPERWWRFAVDRAGEHLRFSDARDLIGGMLPEVGPRHVGEALRCFPFPLDEPYDRRAGLVDALVERLPYDALADLVGSLLGDGREEDARRLVISAGADPALASVIAAVGVRIDDEEVLGHWAIRVALGGRRRWRRSDPAADDCGPDSPSLDARTESLRAAARELGGRAGRVIDLIADAL